MPTARHSRRKLIMLAIFAVFLVPLIARAALYAAGNGPRSWRDADWSSTGTLPPAASRWCAPGCPSRPRRSASNRARPRA